MTICLDESQIEDLVAGALDDADEPQLHQHVEQCEVCRVRVDDARRNAELFGELKGAWQDTESSRRSGTDRSDGPEDRGPGWEGVGEPIAGFEIVGEISRGGQGVVYKAIQTATRRTVALKVLLHGPGSSLRSQRRFEREVDLVAGLRHPNIVTLYDSGTHGGRHYFAMELVDGRPLDQHAESLRDGGGRPLDRIRELLTLFREVCRAVSYAHQRGVIHRDLKPGNILVDSSGSPHVLDFGLAKLSDDSAEPASLRTRSGEFLGTLAYASPEQAQGVSDIDTRCDVYSLGVILYEMLTGELPYATDGSLRDVLQNICDKPPRQPAQLNRHIDDEVETMLLKTLAKEPERRYSSAEQLGRDIEHYLTGQPIDAKRESAWYMARKLVHRYRVPVTGLTGLVAAVLASAVVSFAFWRVAVNERDLARQAEGRATTARNNERGQRQIAEHLRGVAETQRTEAQRLQGVAEAQREVAEFQAYVASVAAAGIAQQTLEGGEATYRLSEAPPGEVNWEWFHIMQRLNYSRTEMLGHGSYVEEAVFSPSGDRVASVAWNKSLRVWDAHNGHLVFEQTLPDAGWSVDYHPDGKQIAVGCWNKTAILFDAETGDTLRTFSGPVRRVASVRFSPDGKWLAASFGAFDEGAHLNRVIVWELAGGKTVAELSPEVFVNQVRFGADRTRLAGVDGRSVRIWKLPEGEQLARHTAGHGRALAFRRDGKQIAASSKRDVVLIDVETGHVAGRLRGHNTRVFGVAYSRDGKRVASGSRDKTVRLWDAETGAALGAYLGHGWTVTSVQFSPDDRRIVSGGWDYSVKIWDAQPTNTVPHLKGHTAGVNALAFSRNGGFLVSGSADKTVRIWDPYRRKALRPPLPHASVVHSVAVSPDQQTIAAGCHDGTIALWDRRKGRRLGTINAHGQQVHAVAFHPDGRLVSGSRDNQVRVWKLDGEGDATQLKSLAGHDDHIHCVVVSPDGRCFASAGHSSIRVWDAATLKLIAKMPRVMIQDDYSLAFHPTGRLLASGGYVRSIALWKVPEGTEHSTMSGHTDELQSVSFSPDGSRLISAAFDGAVRLWDLKRGQPLVRMRGYEGHVRRVVFGPDGNQIAGGTDQGDIVLWESIRPPSPDLGLPNLDPADLDPPR